MAISNTEIRNRIGRHFPGQPGVELCKVLESINGGVNGVGTAFNTLVTKLNADSVEQNAKAAFPLTMDTNYQPATW